MAHQQDPIGVPADRARSAMTQAFVAGVQRRDTSVSVLRRLWIAAIVVVVVAGGAVVVGFLVRYLGGSAAETVAANPSPDASASPETSLSPSPSESAGASVAVVGSAAPPTAGGSTTTPPPPPAAPAAPAAPATFTGVAGVGCPGSDRQNWYEQGRSADWYETGGGSTGDGCSGRSLSMPMSGSATDSTGANYVVWWFQTAPVIEGTCRFSVYIPNTGNPRDVAGHPALYKILGGRTSTTPYASFQIDQTVSRGRWVGVGPVAVHGGGISLHLADRGSDPNGEHIAAAQARVTCTAN